MYDEDMDLDELLSLELFLESHLQMGNLTTDEWLDASLELEDTKAAIVKLERR